MIILPNFGFCIHSLDDQFRAYSGRPCVIPVSRQFQVIICAKKFVSYGEYKYFDAKNLSAKVGEFSLLELAAMAIYYLNNILAKGGNVYCAYAKNGEDWMAVAVA